MHDMCSAVYSFLLWDLRRNECILKIKHANEVCFPWSISSKVRKNAQLLPTITSLMFYLNGDWFTTLFLSIRSFLALPSQPLQPTWFIPSLGGFRGHYGGLTLITSPAHSPHVFLAKNPYPLIFPNVSTTTTPLSSHSIYAWCSWNIDIQKKFCHGYAQIY